jgi:hypothetical protein
MVLNCAGELLTWTPNIGPGWKGLAGISTLVYSGAALITTVKRFIVQAPDKFYQKSNLECLTINPSFSTRGM